MLLVYNHEGTVFYRQPARSPSCFINKDDLELYKNPSPAPVVNTTAGFKCGTPVVVKDDDDSYRGVVVQKRGTLHCAEDLHGTF